MASTSKPSAPSKPSKAKAAAAAAKASALADDGEPWTLVLKVRRCFVHQVPVTDGHVSLYCEAWGLDTPLFTGELQCLAKGQYLHLRLIGADDAIFADSVWLDCSTANNPIPLEAFIQGAHDSSRYFIIKVGDPGPKPKRSVALGIGFRERNSAFDLNAAISDRIHLCQKTGAHADEGWGGDDAKETEAAEAKLAAAAQDLSLKDGQRIRVNLKPNKRGTGNPLGLPDDEDEEEEEGGGKAAKGGVKAPAIALVQKGGSLLLAPPPSSESSVQEFEEREKVDKKKGKKSAKKEPAPVVEDDADEFGDFESA